MRIAGVEVGLDRPLFLIAGPCAIESRTLALETAGRLKEITAALGISRPPVNRDWRFGRAFLAQKLGFELPDEDRPEADGGR